MLVSLFNEVVDILGSNVYQKDTPTQVFSCEYSEIFKKVYFELETSENEIYLCFFMSEVIHSLLSKVKFAETLFSK